MMPRQLTCLAIALWSLYLPVATAAPKVIEETTKLSGPGDSVYFGVTDLALDGNRLAVVTTPGVTSGGNVWLYERNSAGVWSAPRF